MDKQYVGTKFGGSASVRIITYTYLVYVVIFNDGD